MYRRAFLVLVLVPWLAISAGFAQDPTKVESTHYRLGFENERVQVVYIHYGPHEKSVMHDHPAGVVVNLTNGHLRFTDQKGSVQDIRALRGEARWFPSFKHKVENLSDTAYDGIYVGVKGSSSASAHVQGTPADIDDATKRILLTFLHAER
jgi:quercetin dioxygenase-like cupin family protein